MKEIEITIDKNGEISIDLIGYQGKGCSADSEKFVKALGKIKRSDKKCDYWQTETKQKQKVRQSF